MRFLIQRVREASVTVEGQTVGRIGKGLLVFVGVNASDVEEGASGKTARETADKMVRKLIGLRIFEDAEGKTNLDLKSVEGQILLVSQFTLYADCRRGNRPSFTRAGNPQEALALYQYIVERCRQETGEGFVEEGLFGADMKVSLVNDGPFTIMLDSQELSNSNTEQQHKMC